MDGSTFLSRVIGSWGLVSYTAVSQDDPQDVIHPLGKSCDGQIHYNPDGYMTAVLQSGDVEPYEDGWLRGTTRELANAGKKTMAYCGPFYVVEEAGRACTLLHHAKISLPPNWNDTVQLRLARMEDEILILSPEEPLEYHGVKRIVILRWRKLPRNDPRAIPQESRL